MIRFLVHFSSLCHGVSEFTACFESRLAFSLFRCRVGREVHNYRRTRDPSFESPSHKKRMRSAVQLAAPNRLGVPPSLLPPLTKSTRRRSSFVPTALTQFVRGVVVRGMCVTQRPVEILC